MWIYADMFAKIEGPGDERGRASSESISFSDLRDNAVPLQRQPKLYYSIWLQFQGVQTPPKLVYIPVRLNFLIATWFNAKDSFSVSLLLTIHLIYLK